MATTLKALDSDASELMLYERRRHPAHLSRRRGKATHLRRAGFRPLATCALIALIVSGLALLLVPVPRASALVNNHDDGHVYILNNDLVGSNSITVFNREEDGSLKLKG